MNTRMQTRLSMKANKKQPPQKSVLSSQPTFRKDLFPSKITLELSIDDIHAYLAYKKTTISSESSSSSSSQTIFKKNKSKSYHKNIFKSFQNSIFIEFLQTHFKLQSFDDDSNAFIVGILDAKEEQTFQALRQAGVPADNILAVEIDEDCGAIKKCPCHIGDLFTFATEDEKYYGDSYFKWPFAGFYFDLCGQIQSQGKAVLLTLKRIQLAPGCVLAFTFTRARVQEDAHKRHKHIFINNCLRILRLKGLNPSEHILGLNYAGDGYGGRGAPMEWFLIFTLP